MSCANWLSEKKYVLFLLNKNEKEQPKFLLIRISLKASEGSERVFFLTCHKNFIIAITFLAS